jgi:hypothetical protein
MRPACRVIMASRKTEPSGESKASASPSRYLLSKATLNERPVWTSTSVTAPSTLSVGESWRTNRIRLTMQPDGNLVVCNEDNRPTWAAITFGQNHKARFQTDGNLVILNADDRPIWAAGSYGHEGAKSRSARDAGCLPDRVGNFTEFCGRR